MIEFELEFSSRIDLDKILFHVFDLFRRVFSCQLDEFARPVQVMDFVSLIGNLRSDKI